MPFRHAMLWQAFVLTNGRATLDYGVHQFRGEEGNGHFKDAALNRRGAATEPILERGTHKVEVCPHRRRWLLNQYIVFNLVKAQ